MARLPNAPLQEVVFELRWELQVDPSSSRQIDAGFEWAQGLLKQIVFESFPVYRRKVASNLSDELVPYQIIHQFWSGESQWPVIQFGPGILTVNDTDANYDWEGAYFPLVKKVVQWIEQAYRKHPKYISSSLRYIDAISIAEPEVSNVSNFIQQNLKVRLKNEFEPEGVLKNINISQIFLLEDNSELELVISTGRNVEQNPALIWQTALRKRFDFDEESLLKWLQKAHYKASDLFKKMTKGELYDNFQ